MKAAERCFVMLLPLVVVIAGIQLTPVYSNGSVAFIGGEACPFPWEIDLQEPTTADLISFSGPLSDVHSNSACAMVYAGGHPVINVDPANRTVEIAIQPPGFDFCIQLWDPVCGLRGEFGPLEAGNWVFFSNNLLATFSLPLEVTVAPTPVPTPTFLPPPSRTNRLF